MVYAFAAIAVSSKVSPTKTTSTNSSPNIFVWFTFCCGEGMGINTTPLTPSFLQLYAKPCAWLPALAQTTPFANSSGDS